MREAVTAVQSTLSAVEYETAVALGSPPPRAAYPRTDVITHPAQTDEKTHLATTAAPFRGYFCYEGRVLRQRPFVPLTIS